MDATPVIARGHNLAVLTPPVPAAAAPLLQAIPESRSILVLTADADRTVQLETVFSRPDVLAVTGLARAQRRLAAGRPGVLIVGAADALALLKRSALRAAEYETVVLAWPEQLDDEGRDALQNVMAEVSRESQRMILAAVAGRDVDALIDRYAFKAVTFGFPPAEPGAAPSPVPLGGAGYVVAHASQFEAARRRIHDALDPEHDEALTVAPCPASREAAEALARPEGRTPPRLVFVVEPCQLAWLRTLFAPLTAVRLPTSLDALEQRAAALRARLARTLESEPLERELFLIGPLLERFDPAEVAAAALKLAASGPGQLGADAERLAAAESPGAGREAGPGGGGGWTKLWIGVGRKDSVRAGDVLGAIVGETKLPAEHVGRIELRELYSLVEVRSEDAERVARALTGTNLRGRRLTARVDRGHPPRAGGPASA